MSSKSKCFLSSVLNSKHNRIPFIFKVIVDILRTQQSILIYVQNALEMYKYVLADTFHLNGFFDNVFLVQRVWLTKNIFLGCGGNFI